MYALRVLLVHVDVEDVVHALADVTKVATLNDFTLVCAWTPEVRGAAPLSAASQGVLCVPRNPANS